MFEGRDYRYALISMLSRAGYYGSVNKRLGGSVKTIPILTSSESLHSLDFLACSTILLWTETNLMSSSHKRFLIFVCCIVLEPAI